MLYFREIASILPDNGYHGHNSRERRYKEGSLIATSDEYVVLYAAVMVCIISLSA